MMYYVGAVALALGAFLIYWALRHRKLVIAARERADANGGLGEIDPMWQAMGAGILPFYAMSGAFALLLLVGGFFGTDLSKHLSIVDLVGLLVLVIGYTVWLIIRTHYHKLGLNSGKAAPESSAS